MLTNSTKTKSVNNSSIAVTLGEVFQLTAKDGGVGFDDDDNFTTNASCASTVKASNIKSNDGKNGKNDKKLKMSTASTSHGQSIHIKDIRKQWISAILNGTLQALKPVPTEEAEESEEAEARFEDLKHEIEMIFPLYKTLIRFADHRSLQDFVKEAEAFFYSDQSPSENQTQNWYETITIEQGREVPWPLPFPFAATDTGARSDPVNPRRPIRPENRFAAMVDEFKGRLNLYAKGYESDVARVLMAYSLDSIWTPDGPVRQGQGSERTDGVTATDRAEGDVNRAGDAVNQEFSERYSAWLGNVASSLTDDFVARNRSSFIPRLLSLYIFTDGTILEDHPVNGLEMGSNGSSISRLTDGSQG